MIHTTCRVPAFGTPPSHTGRRQPAPCRPGQDNVAWRIRADPKGQGPCWLVEDLDLGLNLPDAKEDLTAQVRRRRVASAVLGHQFLDDLLQAELAQARPALVQVLADLIAIGVGDLVIEVRVNLLEDLATRHLVRASAAHDLSSSASPAA